MINTAGQKVLIIFPSKHEFVFLDKTVCVFDLILFLRKDANGYAELICTILISSAMKCFNNDLDYIELPTTFFTTPNLLYLDIFWSVGFYELFSLGYATLTLLYCQLKKRLQMLKRLFGLLE